MADASLAGLQQMCFHYRQSSGADLRHPPPALQAYLAPGSDTALSRSKSSAEAVWQVPDDVNLLCAPSDSP